METDDAGTSPAAATLDWSVFENSGRLAFVEGIDERSAEQSLSLDRVTRVAATASGTSYSQISLIGTSQFVPSAHGLVYELAQQHTPIRDSLCSVTMALGSVLRVPDARTHEWTRHLPPVASGIVGSYLGVPLFDPADRPIGALCVFDPQPRQWRPEDESMLTDLAQLVTRELALMAALETASTAEVRLRGVITDLLNRPRQADGRSLRARAAYRFPADAPAGGDWVDWIQLPDRVAISIGDVAGHGLGSIAVMEELRHALRAYAFESVSPADAIARTSTLLTQLRPGELATAIKADVNPESGRVRLAVAGHLPPIHLSNGSARLVPVVPGPPLGTLIDPPVVSMLHLGEGDRLLFFTDGVCERRGENIDVGLERLRRSVERHGGAPDLGQAAEKILDEMVRDLRDDACVLFVERFGELER